MRPLDAEAKLMRLAARRFSVFTRRQALSEGLSAKTIDRYLRTERWLSLHSGVYVAASVPVGWEQRIAASLLACGSSAVASYRSAARIWAFKDELEELHVTVPTSAPRRRPGINIHRSDRLDAVTHRGFRVTSPMRTLLDSAGTETRRDLELWIDSAHRRRLIDLERFCACLAVPANRFRPGVALLRAIIASRDTATPIETELETILFATLREGGLPLPTPQCWVRTRKKNRRIDFCYPKSKIAIEVDGWTDHGLRAAFEADRIRGNELEEMGWHVLRFTWLQLKSSPVDIRVTVGIALGLTPVRWRSATGKRITAFGKRRQQQPQ